MKLSEIDKYWHLLEAAREGKTIQMLRNPTGREDRWMDRQTEAFNSPPDQYRIKPEPLVLWVNEYENDDGSKSVGETFAAPATAIRHGQHLRGYIRTIKLTEVTDEN